MVDAGSLRSEGEQAFLIYYGAGKERSTRCRMKLEDGKWKVGAPRRRRPLLARRTSSAQSRQTTCSRPGPTPTSRIGTPTKSAM